VNCGRPVYAKIDSCTFWQHPKIICCAGKRGREENKIKNMCMNNTRLKSGYGYIIFSQQPAVDTNHQKRTITTMDQAEDHAVAEA